MKRIGSVMLLVSFVVLAGFWASGVWQASAGSLPLAAPPGSTPIPPQRLTLLQAWEILDIQAKKWQAKAAIASVQSVDVEGDTSSSGQDGRRRGWLAILVGPDSQGPQLWVRLVDGIVAEQVKQPPAPQPEAISSKPVIDSPQALSIARSAKSGFEPANGEAKGMGFHFAIQGSSKGPRGLAVSGFFQGRPAFIDLDATTGNIISAQVQTYAQSGGILYSTNAGATWRASDLAGKMVTSVYPNPLKENHAYASVATEKNIAIYETLDGGQTWKLMSTLPDLAGDWPFALRALTSDWHNVAIVVSTWSGLWVSNDGKAWSRALGLPEGPIQWLGVVQSDKGYRLLASVTVGKARGLYASTDLSNWKQVAAGSYRLSESFDRQTVLATDEQQAGQSLLLTLDEERSSKVPNSVLRAAGNFNDSSLVILDDSFAGVGRFSDGQTKQTLEYRGASLAAAPDFPTSRIAVLGGFRTGIFRTADAGQTWLQVIANPSETVAGSNEIFDVKFLSRTFVIAVNGGGLTWQGF